MRRRPAIDNLGGKRHFTAHDDLDPPHPTLTARR